ncbi:hypothetical protein LEP1GSC036_2412 [Leptospira weilii str. 2006001853]|uniref:Uncharacterized protein n=1 Tax=Leptospira weilii str. 2006001853 TaxID=1001589 RepID=A0A828YW27_9LEPT|nr:hypothetical protein LEP1GSC036_2412 [Leptospira weilii str. 2006001853]EMN45205.1 hypothetical protein LEP1GSC086_1263 [Leptospira weilii str. LNT 1234]
MKIPGSFQYKQKYSTKTKLTRGSGTDVGVMISFKEETP